MSARARPIDTAVAAIIVDTTSVKIAISWTSATGLSCGSGASGLRGLAPIPGCLDMSISTNQHRCFWYDLASDTGRGFGRTKAAGVTNEGHFVNVVSKPLTP